MVNESELTGSHMGGRSTGSLNLSLASSLAISGGLDQQIRPRPFRSIHQVPINAEIILECRVQPPKPRITKLAEMEVAVDDEVDKAMLDREQGIYIVDGSGKLRRLVAEAHKIHALGELDYGSRSYHVFDPEITEDR